MKGLRDVHTQSVLKREEVQAQEQSNSQVIDALRQYPSPPHTSSAWDHGTGRRRRRPGQHSTRRVLVCSRCLSRVPSVSSHVEKLSQFESFHHFSSHITSSSSLSTILATPPYSPPPNSARAKPRLLHLTLPPRANTDHACRHLHLHLHLFADLSSHPLLHGTR